MLISEILPNWMRCRRGYTGLIFVMANFLVSARLPDDMKTLHYFLHFSTAHFHVMPFVYSAALSFVNNEKQRHLSRKRESVVLCKTQKTA